MKTPQLFYTIIILLICFSCVQKETKDNTELVFESENYNTNGNQESPNYQNNSFQKNTNNQDPDQPKTSKNGLKRYDIMSQQFGMPVGAMIIPSTWKKMENNSENIYFEDAKGVKVYNEVSNSFSYHNNPQRNQFTIQNGGQVKPVKTLQRFIDEELKPYIASQGGKFINQFPLPQLAQFDKQFDSYLFKATPEQRQTDCIVTEWEGTDGNLSMVIVRYFIAQYTSVGGLNWGYTINGMEAPKSEYENAKKACINALINFQINPQWVQTNNQYYAQVAQQNNTNHQQRMASIKAQGQQILANGRANSQALDNQYNNWKNNQAASDKSHSNYINGIYDRQTVTNQNTGQQYQVDGYDNQVWMNNDNEYMSNNDALYNPNLDNSVNNQEWTQLETDD